MVTVQVKYVFFCWLCASYSCNEKWYTLKLRLQNSAARRRRIRRGCTCARRPKFLRLRRKPRKRICKCNESNENQFELNTLNRRTIECCKGMHMCRNIAGRRCQGTNTCYLESHDDEIQGLHGHNKNVCRFTVDAYFT